jgi:predicted Zn-dependent protease
MAQSRIGQLQNLLEHDPGDHTLHYMLGLEYLDHGDPQQAAVHLEKYLAIEEARNGDVGSCLGRLAEAYREMGRIQEALQACRRGIESAIRHRHADLRNELTEAMQALQAEFRGE